MRGSPSADPATAPICWDTSAASNVSAPSHQPVPTEEWCSAMGAPSLVSHGVFPRSAPPEAMLARGDPASCPLRLHGQTWHDAGTRPGLGQAGTGSLGWAQPSRPTAALSQNTPMTHCPGQQLPGEHHPEQSSLGSYSTNSSNCHGWAVLGSPWLWGDPSPWPHFPFPMRVLRVVPPAAARLPGLDKAK